MNQVPKEWLDFLREQFPQGSGTMAEALGWRWGRTASPSCPRLSKRLSCTLP